MRCPDCDEINEEGYHFCRACGRPLPTVDTAAPNSINLVETLAAEVPIPNPVVPAREPPIYKLIATSGLLRGRSFTIGPKGLAIGRDPAHCQVIIADDEVSRLHAWVGYNAASEVVIRDSHSANGTFVNQVRIKEKVLKPADEIAVGPGQRHRFRIESAEVATGQER